MAAPSCAWAACTAPTLGPAVPDRPHTQISSISELRMLSSFASWAGRRTRTPPQCAPFRIFLPTAPYTQKPRLNFIVRRSTSAPAPGDAPEVDNPDHLLHAGQCAGAVAAAVLSDASCCRSAPSSTCRAKLRLDRRRREQGAAARCAMARASATLAVQQGSRPATRSSSTACSASSRHPGQATPAPVEPCRCADTRPPLLLLQQLPRQARRPAPSPTAPSGERSVREQHVINFFIDVRFLDGPGHHHHPAGSVALSSLPIARFPQITPPTIVVSTVFPAPTPPPSRNPSPRRSRAGQRRAAHDLHGLESANDGSYSLTVTFDVAPDQDIAAVDVQNQVAIAQRQLPQQVLQQGVTWPSASRRSCGGVDRLGRPALRLPAVHLTARNVVDALARVRRWTDR